MHRLLRVGAVVFVLALLPEGGGVASADPAPIADVTQLADTDEGWHLTAALTRMTLNSVPNMAATAFTREGFVTARAEADIDGNGKSPVNTGTLILGALLGCQIDLSRGMSLGLDADFGIGLCFLPISPFAYADLGDHRPRRRRQSRRLRRSGLHAAIRIR